MYKCEYVARENTEKVDLNIHTRRQRTKSLHNKYFICIKNKSSIVVLLCFAQTLKNFHRFQCILS